MTIGVAFPFQSNGKVSTTATAKAIWCASVNGISSKLASNIESEKDWRHKYAKYLCALKELELESPEQAVKIATQGLDAVYSTFVFNQTEGSSETIADALAHITDGFTSAQFSAEETSQAQPFSIDAKEGKLVGDEASALVKSWVEYGSAEQGVLDATSRVASLSAADLRVVLDKHVFVLLGATSEMGPCMKLLELGATVVAIARCGKKLQKLISKAQKLPGTLVVPVPQGNEEPPEQVAGADLIQDTPKIINWLSTIFTDKVMLVHSLAYLDGEAHVRASVSMDCIAKTLIERRSKGTVALGYLCSPAIACSISKEQHQACLDNAQNKPFWQNLMLGLKPNARPLVKGKHAYVNGFVTFQGPNYALAKSIQVWRAVLVKAQQAENNVIVSCTMAPPCRTESVVHSKTAAAAIEGMAIFKPNRAFDAPAVSATLTAVLLDDLSSTSSAAQPSVALDNPNEIVVENSFHGGCHRCGFEGESTGKIAFVAGYAGYKYE